ncbi:Putative Short chain dehydrogenase/reductase [Penicillium brasilianum]|uniref:Putative Short chain dehydrogenase/reductase n=1 Tax=Penicillium brasilianum TaxID=104259 RepID=A0A0F7U3P0_PENBI|nr:Putative Short chain dehydrogenase/reductase [Penicillium brasilianum]
MGSVIQENKTALITGAASGVGFAIAKLCRSKGMNLALLDIDQTNLVKAKNVLHDLNPSLLTEAYVIDVADIEIWKATAQQIARLFPSVDLVVLNAGKGYKPQGQESGRLNPWLDGDYWQKTFDTNVRGPLNGLEALLPILRAPETPSPKSIVITGSKQGITNPPGAGNPAYNASKAAIKSLTEHLAHDLRSDPATTHISAHLLIPGWTWTGLMGNVGPTNEAEIQKPAGAWYPSQVAEELLKGLESGSFYIICPDGETTPALDQARMKWASDDVIEGRPALSRWDEKWKAHAEEAIQADAKLRSA